MSGDYTPAMAIKDGLIDEQGNLTEKGKNRKFQVRLLVIAIILFGSLFLLDFIYTKVIRVYF